MFRASTSQGRGQVGGAQGVVSRVQVVIDDEGIVVGRFLHLGTGIGQAAQDDFLAVQAAAAQAAFQFFHGGRQDEEEAGIGHVLAQLGGALHVDVEQDVLAFGQHLAHRGQGRAVEVAVHLGPFGKMALVAQLHEALAAQEMIVLAVHFALAGGAGGAGDGIAEVGEFLAQAFDERGLPRAGGRADDQRDAESVHDVKISFRRQGPRSSVSDDRDGNPPAIRGSVPARGTFPVRS